MELNDILENLTTYKICDKLEQAHFLAQAAHESQGFTKLVEGERYRVSRAKVIWPRHAEKITQKQKELNLGENDFCPQPWLFNTVYGNRMGNNGEDGYYFRGSGIFQLTGRENYTKFLAWAQDIDKTLTIQNITDFCRTEKGAILSAIWYWTTKQLGKIAVTDNLQAVTKAINGGLIGLEERQKELTKYKKILGIS